MKNIKVLKLVFITGLLIIFAAGILYLHVLPRQLNELFTTDKIPFLIEQKTGLKFSYKKAVVKTTPSLCINFYAEDLSVKDKNGIDVASAKKISASVFLPALLMKKVVVKTAEVNRLDVKIIRKKDKKLYFGSFPLDISRKLNINSDIHSLFINNTDLVLQDEIVKKELKTSVSKANAAYQKNRKLALMADVKIFVNGKEKSSVNIDFYSRLPLENGLKYSDLKCMCSIKNLDISDYTGYLAFFTGQDILSSQGIINLDITNVQNIHKASAYSINGNISNFAINMKNPLDTIKSKTPVNIASVIFFDKKILNIEDTQIKSGDWQINVSGKIKNYSGSKPKADLVVDIPKSDINSLYWLVPSIKGDPFNVMEKFKKYGVWGKVKGSLQIKGNIFQPDIYGKLSAEDVYIVKNNPLVPHCKVYAEFLKNKVRVKTRVFAGYGEYVDVEGIAEMKFYGTGDFRIVSSKNVDLSTAEYMLVPVHEVIGFDLGPVPYMDITGKGNIDIRTKGTILDGDVVGKFNFRNTTAVLEGLNTKIEKADGELVFDHKNMHFYTTSAFINGQQIKIDGKANLDGHIDFDVESPDIEISDLFNILTTSKILENKKFMADPLESVSGKIGADIKIRGIVKDFGEIAQNQTLRISGLLNLSKYKGIKAKLKGIPVIVNNTKGHVNFDDTDWNAGLNGNVAASPLRITGGCKKGKTDIKITAQNLKTDDFIPLVLLTNKEIKNLPKTNSSITFDGHYKSDEKSFNLDNFYAKGSFKQSSQKNTDISILSGDFTINNGDLTLKNFRATIYGASVYINGTIHNFFASEFIADGHVKLLNFNLNVLNKIKQMQILPYSVYKILNAYENYEGNINADIDCRNNNLNGYIDLKDIKFNHSYFKTPVTIDSGKVVLDGKKATLRSIIAQIDNTPVFLNISIWDLDKTAKINGYLTTKLGENFVNKYINSRLTYPLKPKGDISITCDLSGRMDNIRLKTKLKFSPDSDIYYMGANIGDEAEKREIYADINIAPNNVYYIKDFRYIRYMISQNAKTYPLNVLKAAGVVEANKKHIFIKNLYVKTLTSANAKIFNIIFKKSVIKNGKFNCNLNIKGNLFNPSVNGSLNFDNLEMPIYNTLINEGAILLNKSDIIVKIKGDVLSSDFTLYSVIKNKINPPVVIDKLDIKSDKLNLDAFIDSLTKIPTPNTATKLVNSNINQNKLPLNVSDFRIKKGSLQADRVEIRNLGTSNFYADFNLQDNMLLNINQIGFDVTTGKMTGNAAYEFLTGKIKANLTALNVDSNKIASSLFDFKDQIFGNANGNIVITTRGNSETERLKNMFGYVYFEIADGKMPKLGSVEYLLKAGNFIKSGITGASISNFIDILSPIKTGHFESIKGSFALKNGVAQNIEIYSKGENLNIYINGEYDILQQYANMKVYGRLTRHATNLLGKIGNMSFNTLLSKIPGFKLNKDEKAKLIQDLNKIPGVELSDQQYRIFTVKIDGNIDENKYVKNFRWIE